MGVASPPRLISICVLLLLLLLLLLRGAGLVGPDSPDPEDVPEGVRALVLKPSVLGGFERTAELAAWAVRRGILAVLSSSFESCLGISQIAQLAAAADAGSVGVGGGVQHGLATLSWFAEDLLSAAAAADGAAPTQATLLQPCGGASSGGQGMGIHVDAADAVCRSAATLALSLAEQLPAFPCPQPRTCQVVTPCAIYTFGLLEMGPQAPGGSAGASGWEALEALPVLPPPVLLLHGFLGAADDWLPLMHALSLGRRCVALDLPSHGRSSSSRSSALLKSAGVDMFGEDVEPHSLEAMAAAVAALVEQEGLQGCLLVGYSLGGRLALLLAARWPHLFAGVACVSGGCRGGVWGCGGAGAGAEGGGVPAACCLLCCFTSAPNAGRRLPRPGRP